MILGLPLRLSRIAMGCGRLHLMRSRWGLVRDRVAHALLDAAFDAGCTMFDNAAFYGDGLSLRIFGQWMRSRRTRDRIIVVSKGGHPARGSGLARVHPAFIAEDLHASLRCLRLDTIDLFMLHRDDPTLPVGIIMEALHRFVQDGKVRAIGASNWSHARIEEANRYAHARGLTPFVASSPHFSLAEMIKPPWAGCMSITGASGLAALAWYTATQMPLLAWSPLASGFLAGHEPSNGWQPGVYTNAENAARRERARMLAAERGVSIAQIAIAYLLAHPINVFPLVTASTPERLRVLFAAARVQLTAREVAWLEDGASARAHTNKVGKECRSPS